MNVNAVLSNRRAFMKWAAVLPMLGAFAVEDCSPRRENQPDPVQKETSTRASA